MNNSISSKWTQDIVACGFTAVPNLLIENRSALEISVTDFYVLVAIEKFRWDDTQMPWPSLNALAMATGLSTRTVNRSTTRLEDLGLVEKIHRYGRSNLYDMALLVEELDSLAKYHLSLG